MIFYPKGVGEVPANNLPWLQRKIRVAVIGGGYDAFIWKHHMAAIDSSPHVFEIVAAAPSRRQDQCAAYKVIHPERRVYESFHKLLHTEKEKDSVSNGADMVVILTETEHHAAIATEALEAGFHVVTDKPPTANLEEMRNVAKIVGHTKSFFASTFNHNSYGAVIEGARIIMDGNLGDAIYAGLVRFSQQWGMSNPQFKQAWRFKGERCCGNDIGSHAERLATKWMAAAGYTLHSVRGTCKTVDQKAFPDRKGDDMVQATLRYTKEGGPAVDIILIASEMIGGRHDALDIDLYGSKGSLRWSHLVPYELLQNGHRLVSGANFTTPADPNPPEHPTGFFNSWDATYAGIGGELAVKLNLIHRDDLPREMTIPVTGVEESLESMLFLEALYTSSEDNGEWVVLNDL